MNRKVKFRGMVIDTGVWVYGYYTKNDISHLGMCHVGHMITYLYNGDFFSIEVDKETIGEFTGLYDKNNREIYEGDIISDGEYNDVVLYNPGCFITKPAEDLLGNYSDSCMVIGNIHNGKWVENKETGWFLV